MLCLGHAKGPAMHQKRWLLWQLDISIAYKFRLLTMIVCWLTNAKAQLQATDATAATSSFKALTVSFRSFIRSHLRLMH